MALTKHTWLYSDLLRAFIIIIMMDISMAHDP